MTFPGGSEGKDSACNVKNPGSIPGSGRSPGEGNGNALGYPCLEKSMDGGAWQAYSPWGCKESDTTWETSLDPWSWRDIKWQSTNMQLCNGLRWQQRGCCKAYPITVWLKWSWAKCDRPGLRNEKVGDRKKFRWSPITRRWNSQDEGRRAPRAQPTIPRGL